MFGRLMVSSGTIAKSLESWASRLRRARIKGKLSTHAHECPRCEAKGECSEANYQDECRYPTRTFCTKCWPKEVPRDAPLPEEK